MGGWLTRLAALAAGVALAAVGCVSNGAFAQLPEMDRELFFRCQHPMQPVLCGDDKDPIYVSICIRSAEADYAKGTWKRRHQWLVANGCPPAMVEPESYVADDDDRPPPKKKRKAQSDDDE